MFCDNSAMTDSERVLAAASRAEDLRRVTVRYQRAKATFEDRRSELHEAITDTVLLLGMSKSEAARISGYTREYVAKICDERQT